MSVASRLRELHITLPKPAAAVGSYVAALRVGDLILTSGQLPMADGRLTAAGKVPEAVPLADAQQAARLAVLNALAAVAGILGGLEDVQRVVRLGVFVNSSPGFTDQAQVANGASDLLLGLFGEAGRHVRAAVGVNELPLGAAVELELTVMVRS